MNNFLVIYKILGALEEAMDYDEFDMNLISSERLEITRPRWEKIMVMLINSGYIDNMEVIQSPADNYPRICGIPTITLKGLEYLKHNKLIFS